MVYTKIFKDADLIMMGLRIVTESDESNQTQQDKKDSNNPTNTNQESKNLKNDNQIDESLKDEALKQIKASKKKKDHKSILRIMKGAFVKLIKKGGKGVLILTTITTASMAALAFLVQQMGGIDSVSDDVNSICRDIKQTVGVCMNLIDKAKDLEADPEKIDQLSKLATALSVGSKALDGKTVDLNVKISD